MTSLAVRVEGIGKQYQLGLREKRNQTFREAVVDMAAAPWRRLRHLSGRTNGDDTFWALKDISFDVPEGEVLGIIGHNGAGKSTLLKILSRITEPTEGRATIHGRVASLLEVGTGFHNELTGRENVYLNGAILGMSRREIDRKFDEIVDFAGVEKFLDTPIKRYSSGMKVRLAFAVAAHLDPEILIIDEVLAVGDQEFQNKCLGKMQDVATSGRTVLFVSHNMAAVSHLCDKALLLKRGHIDFSGSVSDVIDHYLSNSSTNGSGSGTGTYDLRDRVNQYGQGEILIQAVRLTDGNCVPTEFIGSGQEFRIEVDVLGMSRSKSAQIGIIVKDATDRWLSNFNTFMSPAISTSRTHRETAVVSIARNPYTPGRYWCDISIADPHSGRLDFVERALPLNVVGVDVYNSGYTVRNSDGLVLLDGRWEIHPDSSSYDSDDISATSAAVKSNVG